MFKAIFSAIRAMFSVVETVASAADDVAKTGGIYARQLRAEAELEVLPALAATQAKLDELGFTRDAQGNIIVATVTA